MSIETRKKRPPLLLFDEYERGGRSERFRECEVDGEDEVVVR